MTFWVIFGVALILSIIGGMLIIRQIVGNHTSTGLSDQTPWGLYIESFFFFSALGAGTIFFTAGVIVFELESYRSLAVIGSAFSFASLVTAGIVLVADLGRPSRIPGMIAGLNPSSPLTWDFFVLGICVLLSLLFFFDLVPGGLLRIFLAVISALAAATFVMLHALFLISRIGPGFRSRPFLALDTLIQALLGGAAVINILTLVSGNEKPFLIRVTLVLIVLVLVVNVGALIGTTGTGLNHPLNRNVIGLHLFNLVFLLYLVGFQPDGPMPAILTSLLILLVVFMEKSHVVRHSQLKPVLPQPFSQFDPPVRYLPSAMEWLTAIGAFGICILLFQILLLLKNGLV